MSDSPAGNWAILLSRGTAKAMRRGVTNAITSVVRRSKPAEEHCPRCGSVCAVWSPLTRRWYQAPGRLRAPLGTGPRANVRIGCDRCRVNLGQTSGAAAGRNWHNGRPLLG